MSYHELHRHLDTCGQRPSTLNGIERAHESLTRSWAILDMCTYLLEAGAPASVVLELISYAKELPRKQMGPDLQVRPDDA